MTPHEYAPPAAMIRCLTRRPSKSLAHGERTHLERVPIDFALAEAQHAAYRDALAGRGLSLIDLPALEAHPDGVFVEDAVLALPEVFILCRPGAASRAAEAELIAPHLPDDRPVVRLDAQASLDGGDVLLVGRTLFVGRSTRTNMAAVSALASAVSRFGYAVEPVPLAGALHLKTAVTALAPDLLLMNAAWLASDAFAGWRRVLVDPVEPFAANSLKIGAALFMQSAHRRTAERVAAAGFSLDLLDISEFARAEAGLTCLSVVIPAVS